MPTSKRECTEQVGLLETAILCAAQEGRIGKLTDQPMVLMGHHADGWHKHTFTDWRGPIEWDWEK